MRCRTKIFESKSSRFVRAFTLIEVMIALAIFFMAIFTILGSVSRSLGAARGLQQKFPDIGMLMAGVALTNKIEEGVGDGDFGDAYPGYVWSSATNEVATNGLFQIDFVVRRTNGKRFLEFTNSVLIWSPNSRPSATGRRL